MRVNLHYEKSIKAQCAPFSPKKTDKVKLGQQKHRSKNGIISQKQFITSFKIQMRSGMGQMENLCNSIGLVNSATV